MWVYINNDLTEEVGGREAVKWIVVVDSDLGDIGSDESLHVLYLYWLFLGYLANFILLFLLDLASGMFGVRDKKLQSQTSEKGHEAAFPLNEVLAIAEQKMCRMSVVCVWARALWGNLKIAIHMTNSWHQIVIVFIGNNIMVACHAE